MCVCVFFLCVCVCCILNWNDSFSNLLRINLKAHMRWIELTNNIFRSFFFLFLLLLKQNFVQILTSHSMFLFLLFWTEILQKFLWKWRRKTLISFVESGTDKRSSIISADWVCVCVCEFCMQILIRFTFYYAHFVRNCSIYGDFLVC